jgi:hypothetical protein
MDKTGTYAIAKQTITVAPILIPSKTSSTSSAPASSAVAGGSAVE